MKKILLSVISVLAVIGIQAQNKTWNFSEFEQATNKVSITDLQEIDGLTVHGGDQKAISFDTANAVEMDGYSFTGRLKFGGTGTIPDKTDAPYLPAERSISFPVTGVCSITVYGASANTSDIRTLNITDGESLLGTLSTLPLDKATIAYTGAAGTIYMYSANSGFNIYLIKAEYGSASGINDATANKTVVSSEYYDITGRKVSEVATGLVIKKLTYDDGTSKVVKSIVRK